MYTRESWEPWGTYFKQEIDDPGFRDEVELDTYYGLWRREDYERYLLSSSGFNEYDTLSAFYRAVRESREMKDAVLAALDALIAGIENWQPEEYRPNG